MSAEPSDEMPLARSGSGRARVARRAFAVVAAVAMVLTALASTPRRSAAQLSPGPLSRAHADLDRATGCFECHAQPGSTSGMQAKCVACHKEIGWMRQQKRGTHARVDDDACAKCHPEHGGRAFDLVAWKKGGPDAFDHREAGFELEGGHAKVPCRTCHQPGLQKSGAAPLIRVKDRTRSWLGLERECVACHRDPHRDQIGSECAKCHDQRAWKPVPGFDHARTAYALTGKHATVACAACHATEKVSTARDEAGKPVPQWKPLAHRECSSCHKDPHKDRFGPACSKCHGTASFHDINKEGFDHARTRYPLKGKHAAVACAACHDPKKAWGPKPAFARCGDCHRDAHAGQATLAGLAPDCAACHTVEGFGRSTMPVADHQRSKYPLAGAHLRALCQDCHVRAPEAQVAALGRARVVMRPAYGACVDCHRDPHGGRFVTAAQPKPARAASGAPAAAKRGTDADCLRCHDGERFAPARYDAAAHAKSRFALDGAHRAVPCAACHAELKAVHAEATLRRDPPGRTLRFEEKARVCADCHADPHGAQFAARADKGACDGCHGADLFVPADRFQHDRDSRFALKGAHAKVPCARCHPAQRGRDGAMRVTYRPTPTACEACHVDAGGSGTPAAPKPGRAPRRTSTDSHPSGGDS